MRGGHTLMGNAQVRYTGLIILCYILVHLRSTIDMKAVLALALLGLAVVTLVNAGKKDNILFNMT